jgi:hypothetical protein
MMNGHDLFPGEIRGSNNMKSVKTAAQLGAEDSIVLAEIHQLASIEAAPVILSFPKSLIAKGLMNRKATAMTSVAGIAVVAVVLAAVSLTHTRDIEADVTASVPAAKALVEPSPIKLSSEAPTNVNLTPSIASDLPETVELPLPPAGAEAAIAGGVKEVEEKIPPAPTVVPEIKTLPVRATNIRIVDEPFEGKVPESDVSASSLIDQFGFGSHQALSVETETVDPVSSASDPVPAAPLKVIDDVKPPQTSTSSNVAADPLPQSTIPAPIPLAKPALTETSQEVSYRVVDRKGEKSGFWRMRGSDVATKQWFVVVEAADANGKTFSVPVKSADTGVVKEVSKWAIEVTEKDFVALSDQLLKNKVIREPIGKAPSKTSQPKWTVSTTGAMLTEW